jgi:hypothetical protein
MEFKKQSKSPSKTVKECANCGGQSSHPYAIDITDARCFCSKPCLQAFETERVEKLLASTIKHLEKEEAENSPLWVSRLHKIEIVFMRALLKGTTKDKLEQLKSILMDRCVDAIENSTDDGDEIYKGMADATKRMVTAFEHWIKVFGN